MVSMVKQPVRQTNLQRSKVIDLFVKYLKHSVKSGRVTLTAGAR